MMLLFFGRFYLAVSRHVCFWSHLFGFRALATHLLTTFHINTVFLFGQQSTSCPRSVSLEYEGLARHRPCCRHPPQGLPPQISLPLKEAFRQACRSLTAPVVPLKGLPPCIALAASRLFTNVRAAQGIPDELLYKQVIDIIESIATNTFDPQSLKSVP
jgi:hypothetical protein